MLEQEQVKIRWNHRSIPKRINKKILIRILLHKLTKLAKIVLLLIKLFPIIKKKKIIIQKVQIIFKCFRLKTQFSWINLLKI